ncbi:p53-like transcription factor [Phycomyces blakesleeanus]
MTTLNNCELTDTSRKRKQEFNDPKYLTPWSDYMDSNSLQQPSIDLFGMPGILQDSAMTDITQANDHSRRHSVAVGELNYHSFPVKQEPATTTTPEQWDPDLSQLFGSSLPSSWSSSSSQGTHRERPNSVHRRTLTLIPDVARITPGPSTPVFFPPNFLDALNSEEEEHDTFQDTFQDTFPLNLNIDPLGLYDPISSYIPQTFVPTDVDEMTHWVLNASIKQEALTPPPMQSSPSTSPSPPIPSLQSMSYAQQSDSLKSSIQHYLLQNSPENCYTAMLLTSKVAQKSYGTEKRFLCPPPSTILQGPNWWTHNCKAPADSRVPSPPRLTVHVSGEAASQTGILDWYSSGTMLDAEGAGAAIAADDPSMLGKCVSKHLHISDVDEKRKRVEVQVNIQLSSGFNLGNFCSQSIKVISKPSKKRQSARNMELCIHHGTPISLFNRIRSQTVSTKYLGVSAGEKDVTGACFVARTGSWDPFIIWIADTTRTQETNNRPPPDTPGMPPPPAIALQLQTNQPTAILYNQAIVLQCATTGLVSPVMIIRKADRGSLVQGGNRVARPLGSGGECGDEALGDPVSQLHKIAFQIVHDPLRQTAPIENCPEWSLPQSTDPITYLACLSEVVGMHRTTAPRTLLPVTDPAWPYGYDLLSSAVSQENGRVVRKRRVSCDVTKPVTLPAKFQSAMSAKNRRRVNSLNDALPDTTQRRASQSSVTGSRRPSTDSLQGINGGCWTEDVSDAAIWTIVGTDCATYTFWTPSPLANSSDLRPVTPFPRLTHKICRSLDTSDNLVLSGEGLSTKLSVWLADIQLKTEYHKDTLSCIVPPAEELVNNPFVEYSEHSSRRSLPLLLVRDDGVVYKTESVYDF